MSFSYNVDLVEECNSNIESVLRKIEEPVLDKYILETIHSHITQKSLEDEFKKPWESISLSFAVDGEHIRNHFLIGLDGFQKIWQQLVVKEPSLLVYQNEPLYENVMEIIEERVDGMNFDVLFQKEIKILNQH